MWFLVLLFQQHRNKTILLFKKGLFDLKAKYYYNILQIRLIISMYQGCGVREEWLYVTCLLSIIKEANGGYIGQELLT